MKFHIKLKTNLLRISLLLLAGILLPLTSCGIPSTDYTTYSHPDLVYTIDYPVDWEPEYNTDFSFVRLLFAGYIGDSEVHVSVVARDVPYQEKFDEYKNAVSAEITLENQDLVINGITYSTFTQTVGITFSRLYMCKLGEQYTLLINEYINTDAPQGDKDTLSAWVVHMVGSLQLVG